MLLWGCQPSRPVPGGSVRAEDLSPELGKACARQQDMLRVYLALLTVMAVRGSNQGLRVRAPELPPLHVKQ
ncbi:hypothetical protein N7466_007867 [Penicillium verhagenii]|uniref:uncharacterized protein n=1 Tax=Penicillium verhagenii TaxID=1562060 RepID=UPI0025456AEF|nr:uncharacterized protein N7466_007867 [Penicillium verhagenii]KAJ5928911.1 hypothetical protein N7466_007867 [Penicillium verhagenii]